MMPLPDRPQTLAAALVRTAELHPLHGVGYIQGPAPWEIRTYPALLAEAARILGGLRAAGLTPGAPVLFQFTDNSDFIPAFWACALGGFVPVPLSAVRDDTEAAAPVRRLLGAWEMLGRPVTLASDAIAGLLRGVAAREQMPGFAVLPIGTVRRHAQAEDWHEARPEDLALLLLTSGSTGRPKAVRQTHRTLLAWANSVAPACGFTPADISLNWMPLDHVGGIVMFHLRDLVLGCRQFHGPTEPVLRDPLVWLDWIQATRATITWAPNFAFGLVNDQAAEMEGRRWDLSALWFILNGGEAIVSKTARRFLELLIPHGLRPTAMRPAWGMSETCSGVTYSRHFTREATSDADPFVSVGAPIPGVEIRIVDSDGARVPDGVPGRLEISGISVTQGYFGDAETTKAAFTADGWFITGDLAIVSDGELTIAGREKDVIIVNGANYFCHEIESVAEEIPGVEVSFTAACPVRLGDEGAERVALFFVPRADVGGRLEPLRREIRRAVTLRAGVAPDFVIALVASEVPKTAIGKIQRTELRQRFERGDFADRVQAGGAPGTPFRAGWRQTDPLPPLRLAAGSPVLVLARAGGIGERLAVLLGAAGHPIALAFDGAGFVRHAPGRFTLDPASQADHQALFAALAEGGMAPGHIVHAWAHGDWPEPIDAATLLASQALGSVSLLHLLHLLHAADRSGVPARILLVTSGALPTEDGTVLDTGKLPLIGLGRTVAHESDTLTLTHLDVDAACEVETVLAELATEVGGSVALRAGLRLVPALEAVDAVEGTDGLTRGGLYLATGATGAVGRLLTRHLVRRHGATLVLMGRGAAPPDWMAAELGDNAAYLGGDIGDPAFARAALALGQARWGGALRGIFHLAGAYHEAPVSSETEAGIAEALCPKLAGAWALHQVARETPDCWFVSFSSLLGHFGAFGTGAYTAANAALDAFSASQRSQGVRAYSIAWSMWEGLGMARLIDPDVPRQRGFQILAPAAALELLERVLRCPPAHYLIGLDPAGRAAGIAPRGEADGADVPPATDLQARLARMWQELLRVPRVGVTVSFFDLGGSSLLAARLFNRIEKELGVSLPIATLFSSPTIAALADVIAAAGTRSATTGLLTPLRTAGARYPLFCISGVGSDAIAFQELAETMGDDQPFYGLQVPGLDGSPAEGDVPTVEEAARDFVQSIRSVQPAGPYHIAGHCFGSLLAWEVARQLTGQQQDVRTLALIDPVVSTEFPAQIVQRDRLRYSMRQFRDLSTAAKLGFAWEKLMNLRRFVLVRKRLGRSIDMAREMYEGYQPPPFAGHAMIFLAAKSFFDLVPDRDPRRYFERVAEGGVTYIRVAGDHDSMLRRPGAVTLAASLQTAPELAPHQPRIVSLANAQP
jgi:acyl-CoA synthetase (AMP-forming)/AMP-acid ligase II/thioesterase domain-containing protein/NADP-dependent 3-hydroxy acid dehydrogenase YdfG/acyl carrier protein